MEILVCVKRVPDTAENEFELNGAGNDQGNYLQGNDGNVTVITVGDSESEEVLRREMAMGANNGILLSDDAFEGSDGKGIATILKAEIEKGKYDLILTGAQADEGAGREDGEQEAVVIRDHGNHPGLGGFAKGQVDAGQQRALAENLAHCAQHGQNQGQAQADHEAVHHGG